MIQFNFYKKKLIMMAISSFELNLYKLYSYNIIFLYNKFYFYLFSIIYDINPQ